MTVLAYLAVREALRYVALVVFLAAAILAAIFVGTSAVSDPVEVQKVRAKEYRTYCVQPGSFAPCWKET